MRSIGNEGEDNRGGVFAFPVLAELAGYPEPSHAGAQRARQEICAHLNALKSHYEEFIYAIYRVDVPTYVKRIAAPGEYMDCTKLMGS